ncbi:MAG TPA: lytic murein transglycosylase, partial [Paracoccaceae bacterium]|nr:lytic murein transglycosylase [Paracoccaceae bacterium]
MRSVFAVLTLIAATSAEAQSCGGSFANFVDDLKAEARAMGYPSGAVDAFFRGVQQDEAVLRADRRQGIFQKDFITF